MSVYPEDIANSNGRDAWDSFPMDRIDDMDMNEPRMKIDSRQLKDLHAVASLLVRDSDKADQLVTDTFTDVYRDWVYGDGAALTDGTLLNRMAQLWIRGRAAPDNGDQPSVTTDREEDSELQPETASWSDGNDRVRQAVFRTMRVLSPAEQLALALFLIHGWRSDRIGDVFGIDPEKADRRLKDARSKLTDEIRRSVLERAGPTG